MEFSLREWLIVIGIFIIVVILVDGFRRYKKANDLSVAIDDDYVDPDELLKEAILKRELPNGGARPAESMNAVNNAFETARKTTRAPLTDLPHKVDSGPSFEKDDQMHLDELATLVPERFMPDSSKEEHSYSDEEAYFEENQTESDYFQEDFERNYSTVDIDQVSSNDMSSDMVDLDEDDEAEIEEVIVINVFAPEDNAYLGIELLQLVLNCGMRYGDMDIFHRHEEGYERGKVQFSMANAIEPGTFDLNNMGESKFPGVSFFMGLPGPKNSMKAFDFMLETAQSLVRNLGGELKDERRNRMSDQTIAHCRQRIRDFERRRLSRVKNA